MASPVRSNGEGALPRVDRRIERKFLLDRGQAERLIAAARSRLRPDRYTSKGANPTQTTYFDTEDQELFRRLRGVFRVRLREYSDGARFLEAKYGTGTERTKLRLPMCGAFAEVWPEVVRALPHDAPMTERVRAGDLAPCVTTQYARQSFVDADKKLRLTVDANLAASPPCGTRKVAFGATYVAEVKYSTEIPTWLERELSRLEEAHEFSKFRWGCGAIGES